MHKELQGFLLVNKPKGISSFDCIRHIKRVFKGTKLKIGHAGTLDSFATGLLILALGRPATRHVSLLMKLDKKYSALGKLGELTNTLDRTGTAVPTEPFLGSSEEEIQETLKKFEHEYIQTPPLFAALKYQGKPLYALARKKNVDQEKLLEIVDQKKRAVTIYELRLLSFKSPFFSIQAHVSHGTYIRSLINDIGQQLGTYATTHELDRTQIGPFSIAQAHDLATLTSQELIEEKIITIPDFINQLKGE